MANSRRSSCCAGPFQPAQPKVPTTASLIIRNLTITPLELKTVERLEAEPVPSRGWLWANVTSTIKWLFGTSQTATGGVAPRRASPLVDRHDVKGITLCPFSTRLTDVRAAGPLCEVLRLTFETPGTNHRYMIDLPGQPPHSIAMARSGDSPCEFTAVYVASGAFLAIFSSANLSRWMAELHDGYPLSVLSIPGTHNSPACHVALPSVRCQAVGIPAQLANGVRFLDVRVSTSDRSDDLALVHSAFPISLTGPKYFASLLSDCYAFLDENPSEVLLMSVKREGTGRGTDSHLARHLVSRYCGGEAARRWFTEARIPTLGEARGRIVLVRRFGVDESLRGEHRGEGWGVDASAWPDNCADGTVGSGTIRLQDFYGVYHSADIGRKIELAQAHLERAAQQLYVLPRMSTPAVPLPLFVNFLSGSNFFNARCWPEKIAEKVNPAVIDYLCTRHGDGGKDPDQLAIGDAVTGIVVTDWVGNNDDWDLIRCIVGWNARLQLKK